MSADDREIRAGEYVLGVLDEREAAEVEADLPRDPALAQAVGRWRERLIELDLAAPRQPAGDDLWARIDGAIAAAAAPRTAVAARPGAFARAWDSLGVWRGVGLAGAFGSAALAAALVAAHLAPPPAPVVVAVLMTADAKPGAIVEVFADNSADLIPIADVAVPGDRALQVWTLPDPAAGPVSIGLLKSAARAHLAAAALPVPKARQLYEITLEPAAGSPTGRPTGPILFKGFAEPPR